MGIASTFQADLHEQDIKCLVDSLEQRALLSIVRADQGLSLLRY